MNRYRWEMKIKRKIKLIKTLPPTEKMRWAGFTLMVIYMSLIYLKGIGVWP